MDYIAPFGSADPNAPYVDRSSTNGRSGSKVPAKAIENPMREIKAVIAGAGITPSNGDLTQLLQAIEALIAAATGGGSTSSYVLMTAARARLPIFPEVLTSDGCIPCLSPSTGTVRVPAGYDFLHRGIFNVTTVQTDFSTNANKTYHLRWNPTDGFQLKDLSDSGYNAAALAESDASFDSGFDSMLVARVITNASNVATIVNLSNKATLTGQSLLSGPAGGLSSPDWNSAYSATYTINWARAPKVAAIIGNVRTSGGSATEYTNYISARTISRYSAAATVNTNWNEAIGSAPTGLTGQLQFDLMA